MAPKRRVYVLRHAKSSWDDPSLSDHDRPLNGRGQRAAKTICKHMREAGVEPEVVLCSTALRARQTLEGVEPALGTRSSSVEPELYGAGSRILIERLRQVPAGVGSVLLIGHNPGLQDLLLELAVPSAARDRVALKFPTAALATLAFNSTDWRGLVPGAAELVAYVRPRDLPG